MTLTLEVPWSPSQLHLKPFLQSTHQRRRTARKRESGNSGREGNSSQCFSLPGCHSFSEESEEEKKEEEEKDRVPDIRCTLQSDATDITEPFNFFASLPLGFKLAMR